MEDLLDNDPQNQVPDPKSQLKRVLYWAGIALIIVGILFKIQHWPFSREVIIGGVIVSFAHYIWSFFDK